MKKREALELLADARRESLKYQDRADDILTGFRLWRDHKIAHGEWTHTDEAFVRWAEHADPVFAYDDRIDQAAREVVRQWDEEPDGFCDGLATAVEALRALVEEPS